VEPYDDDDDDDFEIEHLDTKQGEVKRGHRKLYEYNEERHNLYSS
jgi:hypothetical protein